MQVTFAGTNLLNIGYVPMKQVKEILDENPETKPDLKAELVRYAVAGVETGSGPAAQKVDGALKALALATSRKYDMPLKACYAYTDTPLSGLDLAEASRLTEGFDAWMC